MHHLAIQVADLPRMERFYREVLGLVVLKRWPAPEGEDPGERSVWLDTGDGSFLALERVLAPADATGPGAVGRPGLHLVALGIRADDRSRWETRLRDVGVAVARRTNFTLYFEDPEGNRIGLSHYPEMSSH